MIFLSEIPEEIAPLHVRMQHALESTVQWAKIKHAANQGNTKAKVALDNWMASEQRHMNRMKDHAQM